MNQRIIEIASDFHLAKRKYFYKKYGTFSNFIKLRYKLHGFLLNFVKLNRIINGVSLEILNDRRLNINKPTIFAVTHVGGDDIESAFEAIKTPAHLLLGDPNELYLNAAGLLLFFNGVIGMDTKDKLDRRICKERAVATLRKGGNVLIFPEGALNISPNQLVYYMYSGAVQMAIEADAQIIPVAVLKNRKNYTVNIGENIDYSNTALKDKYILTEELRDTLATLQYENIESQPMQKHEILKSDSYAEFVNDVINSHKGTSFGIKDVYETRYKPKNITSNSDAFSHLNTIDINAKTAFLFNKRLF